MNPLADQDLVGIREAAEITGLSVHSLRRYAARRLIPYYQRGNRTPLLFDPEELAAWREPKRFAPKAEEG